MSRIVVVGGGIAGLAVAHALVSRDAGDVLILEASDRPGGNVRSERIDGFLCEWGPNGFLDNVPATLELVHALGLDGRLQPSDDRASRRYIFRHGRLHPLPGGPASFLASGLLSWRGKLRIAGEPWARRRPDGDETIHAFAARRIGREAADVLIDAMVSGVFGGDARRLSLRACFPKMWEMEGEHGGLFRALWARRRNRRAASGGAGIGSPLGRLTSFAGGTEELIRGLVAALGERVRTGTAVTGVEKNGPGYTVRLADGSAIVAGGVVLAAGARATTSIVTALDAELAGILATIPSAPMVVVCLGYRESALPEPLDGFGFLVPRGEGPRILGVLWDSSVYPGRAPAGSALMRAMLGGAHDPDAIGLDDEAVMAVVRADLRATMGLRAEPYFVRIFRHPIGIPQYTVGHLDRLAAAEARLARFPRVALAGNAYRGVAINNCVAEAAAIAARVR
jgi:oxygen-dependent protoporphyrinogen oxidase